MSIDMLCKIINTAYQGEEQDVKDLCQKFDKLYTSLGRHIIGMASAKKRFEAMVCSAH